MTLDTRLQDPYPRLVASLAECPIVQKGAYDYFVHPLADGVPRVEPELLREAAEGLAHHLDPYLEDVDVLLTAEAMGLPLVAALSLATGKPSVVARKRAYGLPGEQAVDQRTGYGGATLYLNGIRRGDRVVIVDDVISTGGTLRALAAGLSALDARLLAVASVFSKEPRLQDLAGALQAPVSALVSCRVAGTPKRVEVLGTDIRG